jgi:hypothetical protein
MDFAGVYTATNRWDVYSDANCSGRATGGVVYPGMCDEISDTRALLTNGTLGIYNLADYNNNDAMSSFRCTN